MKKLEFWVNFELRLGTRALQISMNAPVMVDLAGICHFIKEKAIRWK
jgi:DNA-directed RNA polymerase subunit K/omega